MHRSSSLVASSSTVEINRARGGAGPKPVDAPDCHPADGTAIFPVACSQCHPARSARKTPPGTLGRRRTPGIAHKAQEGAGDDGEH
jgi:hypothetical protein